MRTRQEGVTRITEAVVIIKETPLNSLHRALGAKMTEFGGWDMPEHYGNIWDEYNAVRTKVGLFDTSHMRAFLIEGRDANAYLQFLTPRHIGIKHGKVEYAVLTNKDGGAGDDCLGACLSPEEYLVVVNAGNIDKDFGWMERHNAGFDVALWKRTRYTGMLALQGPRAEKVLTKCVANPTTLQKMKRYNFFATSMEGYTVLIFRTGYTGEDGFEIFCEPVFLPFFWEMLLVRGDPEGIAPCGLGARDLCRLEAWMPLYEHELTEERGPVEANLRFAIDLHKPFFFIGRAAIESKYQERRRETLIGLRTIERGAIIRRGCDIATANGNIIGRVSSGAPYPNGTSLGMGFVTCDGELPLGTSIQILIHKKWRPAFVAERKWMGTSKEEM